MNLFFGDHTPLDSANYIVATGTNTIPLIYHDRCAAVGWNVESCSAVNRQSRDLKISPTQRPAVRLQIAVGSFCIHATKRRPKL